MPDYTYEQIAKMIDHSLLNPTLTDRELEEGCRIAAVYGTASVCIMPYYARRCAELLEGSGVITSTTIGFPHGGQHTDVKMCEARHSLRDGAVELDMVINISKAKSEDWDYVANEIRAVTDIVHGEGAKIKVIFENFYQTEAAKIRLCEICG